MNEVRTRVLHHLFDVTPDVQDAAIMCASELAENGVKYGCSGDHPQLPALDVIVDENTLTLRLETGVADPSLAEATCGRVAAIRAAEDPRELYLRRMREVALNPGQRATQLGLFRLRCEGQFELNCEYRSNQLTLTATRSLS